MADENIIIEESESAKKGESTEFDPVQAINELKQNTVKKEEYNKVVDERNKYLKALIDGGNADLPGKAKEPVDVDELRKSLFGKDLSNLDYAKKSLELREAILEEKGVDIFAGKSRHYNPDDNDYAVAQKVADALQSCIDIADGDTEIFTRELMRITNESHLPTKNIDSRIRR